jgi:F-type H+-transporting ATPase subunit b
MEQTLQQLGELLLGSIPTIIIFLILHSYLKAVLYQPLMRVLRERSSRTEGKFDAARSTLTVAEGKASGYEDAIRSTRLDAYRLIDERRKHAMEERATLMARARAEAEKALQSAQEQIAADMVEAKKRLRHEADHIGNEIVETVLRRSVLSRPTARA